MIEILQPGYPLPNSARRHEGDVVVFWRPNLALHGTRALILRELADLPYWERLY